MCHLSANEQKKLSLIVNCVLECRKREVILGIKFDFLHAITNKKCIKKNYLKKNDKIIMAE